MKRIVYILLIHINCITIVTAQELTTDQVCNLLGELATQNFKTQLYDYEGEIEIKFHTTKTEIKIDYCWNENEDITFESDVSDVCNTLVLDLENISKLSSTSDDDGRFIIQVDCNSGTKDCIYFDRNDILNYYYNLMHDDPESRNHYNYVNLFYFSDFETQKLTIKGIQYLAYELNESKNNSRGRASSFDYYEGSSVVKIDLKESGGVSELPISMGGIVKMAILDSGASDVSLPESVENQLLQNGIIREENYLPSGMYVVADGRTILSRRFIIPRIEVDGVYVNNVTCSVNESDNIILLGRAFLDAFKSWSVNNETNQLILKY